MSAKSQSTCISEKLLARDPTAFKAATQCDFLVRAGNGALSKDILQKWLSQDRLYAQAYIRFAALLLANVPLNGIVDPQSFNEELTDLLLASITNVRRELRFFEEVANNYGLDIDTSEGVVSEAVQAYRDLFFSTGAGVESGEISMLEGLVLLWATEKCYLEAWRYARSSASGLWSHPSQDADGGALRKEFIPNWTSHDFETFVVSIERLMNKLWESGDVFVRRQGRGEVREHEERYVELWDRVLRVEKAFWPTVQQE